MFGHWPAAAVLDAEDLRLAASGLRQRFRVQAAARQRKPQGQKGSAGHVEFRRTGVSENRADELPLPLRRGNAGHLGRATRSGTREAAVFLPRLQGVQNSRDQVSLNETERLAAPGSQRRGRQRIGELKAINLMGGEMSTSHRGPKRGYGPAIPPCSSGVVGSPSVCFILSPCFFAGSSNC